MSDSSKIVFDMLEEFESDNRDKAVVDWDFENIEEIFDYIKNLSDSDDRAMCFGFFVFRFSNMIKKVLVASLYADFVNAMFNLGLSSNDVKSVFRATEFLMDRVNR